MFASASHVVSELASELARFAPLPPVAPDSWMATVNGQVDAYMRFLRGGSSGLAGPPGMCVLHACAHIIALIMAAILTALESKRRTGISNASAHDSSSVGLNSSADTSASPGTALEMQVEAALASRDTSSSSMHSIVLCVILMCMSLQIRNPRPAWTLNPTPLMLHSLLQLVYQCAVASMAIV